MCIPRRKLTGLQKVYGTSARHNYWKKQHKDLGLVFEEEHVIDNMVRMCWTQLQAQATHQPYDPGALNPGCAILENRKKKIIIIAFFPLSPGCCGE